MGLLQLKEDWLTIIRRHHLNRVLPPNKRKPHFYFPLTVGVMLLAMLSAGCGGNTAEVSGTVKYQGKALPSGKVTFISEDGKIMEFAMIDSDGSYKITKAPLGSVKITVTTPPSSQDGGPEAAKDLMKDAGKHMPGTGPKKSTEKVVPIPGNYGDPQKSGLTYEVKKGSQQHDIDLK
jgi:hypothetical protein